MSSAVPSFYAAPRLSQASLSWSKLAYAVLHGLSLSAFVAQALISSLDTNLLTAALALASATISLEYLRRSQAFLLLPLSSFAVLGLCLTTQWGALVAQSITWTPIVENLRDPVGTFVMLGLFQCVAIVAHLIHRGFHPLVQARTIGANVLWRLRIFEIPAPVSLWLMGAVGFVSFVIGAAPGEVNLGDRLLAGFWPFAWAPFTIPILSLRYGPAYCNLRLHTLALAVYVLMTVALAMALNYRNLMAQGATTTALMMLLTVLTSERPFRWQIFWRLVPVMSIAALVARPVSDLSTAMLIARGDRGHVPPIELLKETYETFQDADAIRKMRESFNTDSRFSAYDEAYISNSVLARFVVTKFHDNAFYFGRDLSDRERDELTKEESDRVWATLPYPVLRAFKIPQDKSSLGHSIADYYANLRNGFPIGRLCGLVR
jgi:hypothetical protein